MDCRDFQARLDEALHGGQPLRDAEGLTHAGQCPACREALEGARRLQEAIVVLKASAPSVDLADRVLARWSAEQAPASEQKSVPRTASWRARIALLTAAAALILVALRLGGDRPAAPSRNVVQAPPKQKSIEPVVARTSDAPVEDLVRSAQSAYLALAQNAAHSFQDAAEVVVPAEADIPSLKGLDQIAPPAALDAWKPTWSLPADLGEWLDKRG